MEAEAAGVDRAGVVGAGRHSGASSVKGTAGTEPDGAAGTADMLHATTIRLTELAELAGNVDTAQTRLHEIARMLGSAERAIGVGFQHKPADGGASFTPGGSHRLDLDRRRQGVSTGRAFSAGLREQHLAREEQDGGLEVEICFEAVRGFGTKWMLRRRERVQRCGKKMVVWLDG